MMDCHGEKFDTLDFLYEVITAIANHQELEEIEAEYLRSIGMLIPAHANAIYLFKPNKPYPVRITATGVDQDFLVYYEEKGRTIDPLRDWIFKNHSPNQSQLLLGLEGWKHHPVYNVVGCAKIDYAMQCPIVYGDQVISTLNFGRTTADGQFNLSDLKAIKILSHFFAIALAGTLRHSNLAKSQVELCQAIEHGQQGIVITDNDFTIQYANKSAQRITTSVFQEQPTQELSDLIRLEYQNQKDKHRASKSLSARFCPLPGGNASQTLIFLDDVISASAHQLLAELLTERQMEVIRLVELGMNNREIADKLGISVNTVKRHLDNLYCKFNVYSRMELISKINRLIRL